MIFMTDASIVLLKEMDADVCSDDVTITAYAMAARTVRNIWFENSVR